MSQDELETRFAELRARCNHFETDLQQLEAGQRKAFARIDDMRLQLARAEGALWLASIVAALIGSAIGFFLS